MMNRTAIRRTRLERGSALLVTLMLIMGLSLLGLGFIAVSRTESSAAMNERNYAQVLIVAEAAAPVVIEWFEHPESMQRLELLPPNSNAFKASRLSGSYMGVYRPSGLLTDSTSLLTESDYFYGDETHPDVRINNRTAEGRAFLDRFNRKLFGRPGDGRITEILVYAPPITGGSKNNHGFWEGGLRHGIATIKVTAGRLSATKGPRAEAYVKTIVGTSPTLRLSQSIYAGQGTQLQAGVIEHWRAGSVLPEQLTTPVMASPWPIRYSTWKQTATQGAEQHNRGIHYLEYAGEGRFTEGEITRTVADWLSIAQRERGFFFFDTKDSLDPQQRGTRALTEPIVIDLSRTPLRGFLYFNTSLLRLVGHSSRSEYVNMPGEPWVDRGFQRFNEGGRPTGQSTFGAENDRWDYQDLNRNGRFDLALTEEADGSGWRPAPFASGCAPGTNCSEPHEPYTNIIYPAVSRSGEVRSAWEHPLTQTRRPKALDNGQIPRCDESGTVHLCTSNGYDEQGALTSDLQPSMSGVLYVEGDLEIDEPVETFGAVIVKGKVKGAGRLEAYTDDRLVRGTWQPPIPRVRLLAWLTQQH